MNRYTIKTYNNTKQLEQFDKRNLHKVLSILPHRKYSEENLIGPLGEALENANKFRIYDSQMELLFEGDITSTIGYVRTLKR